MEMFYGTIISVVNSIYKFPLQSNDLRLANKVVEKPVLITEGLD